MKKLIYLLFVFILCGCPSGGENFNPGAPSQPDTTTINKPEKPEEPETPKDSATAPKVKVLNIELSGQEDKTRELRSILTELENGTDKKPSIIHFDTKNPILTHGMLPSDLDSLYGRYRIGDIGKAKILKLYNKEHIVWVGGEFINPERTFPLDDNRPSRKRDYFNTSENVFLHIEDSKNISIVGLKYTGPHYGLNAAIGFPKFYVDYEYEHAIDIMNSQNIYIEGLDVKHVMGDMVYLRKTNNPGNKNITIVNSRVYWNGRQGIAWGDADNVYIANCRIEFSGRGGVDVEPPREFYKAQNVIIKNSYFKTHLLPFPMGGLGTIDGVLVENNVTETNSHHTAILGDRQTAIRKNIIFRGNKSKKYFGSTAGNYLITGAENILIENEETKISSMRSGVVAEINNCRNVVIRNNDFKNGKYIKVIDTPLDEIKIYGNVQDLKLIVYSFEMPFKEAPNLFDIRKTITDPGDAYDEWNRQRREWISYMDERRKTATSEVIDAPVYDVEKYGEPDVPEDPDFKPYMGIREFNKSLQKIIDDLNIKL